MRAPWSMRAHARSFWRRTQRAEKLLDMTERLLADDQLRADMGAAAAKACAARCGRKNLSANPGRCCPSKGRRQLGRGFDMARRKPQDKRRGPSCPHTAGRLGPLCGPRTAGRGRAGAHGGKAAKGPGEAECPGLPAGRAAARPGAAYSAAPQRTEIDAAEAGRHPAAAWRRAHRTGAVPAPAQNRAAQGAPGKAQQADRGCAQPSLRHLCADGIFPRGQCGDHRIDAL